MIRSALARPLWVFFQSRSIPTQDLFLGIFLRRSATSARFLAASTLRGCKRGPAGPRFYRLFRLGNYSNIGLGRLPTLWIFLLRVVVGNRTRNNHIAARFPIYRC